MQSVIVQTQQELAQLTEYLKDKEFVSFDTETTGTKKGSLIVGLSVCAEDDKAYYVILFEYSPSEDELYPTNICPSQIHDFLTLLKTKELIMHNGVFDCMMVENNYRVQLMPSLYFDTMIAAHLCDENNSCKLKELGVRLEGIEGIEAKDEQDAVLESAKARGGKFTGGAYELYKADPLILAEYGAKDAHLTFMLHQVFAGKFAKDEKLLNFFSEESMPLFRGPTYQLNSTGLKVDTDRLGELKASLEAEIAELQNDITNDIKPFVENKYPGTSKTNTFNIGSGQQLSWLLHDRLGNLFHRLTDRGKELSKFLIGRVPYTKRHKYEFIAAVKAKQERGEKVSDYWTYISTDEECLLEFKGKYRWVAKLLQMKKSTKLLNTYVTSILEKTEYGVIRPSFVQIGTTSGRYSSREPNFQNLPSEDKRIKQCLVARPGRVFVGADYEQLEPRVFASVSQDPTLMACFASGDDFYSVIGARMAGTPPCPMKKDDPQGFATLYPAWRKKAKVVALATPYGQTAAFQAQEMGIDEVDAQETIDAYFDAYPMVRKMMLDSHEMAKRDGVVYSLFGRPRRIPEAKKIEEVYKRTPHAGLPYQARTLLNLGMNHRVQSTAASLVNRACIAFYRVCKERGAMDPRWDKVSIVMQIHDEVVAEGPEEIAGEICAVLKDCMENTSQLPGVGLVAKPKVAYRIGELK